MVVEDSSPAAYAVAMDVTQDPFELMVAWRIGDLCEIEAIMALEEEFGIDFEEQPDDFIMRATFRDVVRWILETREASQASHAHSQSAGVRPPLGREADVP